MMNANPPRHVRLVTSWAVLIGLTVLSLTAGDAAGSPSTHPLGLIAVGLVLGAAFFKARQILWAFLGLGRSTRAWQATFIGFLLFICSIIFAAYGIGLVRLST